MRGEEEWERDGELQATPSKRILYITRNANEANDGAAKNDSVRSWQFATAQEHLSRALDP